MKNISFYLLFSFALIMSCSESFGQKSINWTPDQLMAPALLAKTLQSNKDLPIIYSIGPGATIPHSIDLGMANDSANLERFKIALNKVPKDANIVVYCGCCPYENCPNVRPAIDVLKSMNFTNFHLLDLPHNIKKDWISKGYPVAK